MIYKNCHPRSFILDHFPLSKEREKAEEEMQVGVVVGVVVVVGGVVVVVIVVGAVVGVVWLFQLTSFFFFQGTENICAPFISLFSSPSPPFLPFLLLPLSLSFFPFTTN